MIELKQLTFKIKQISDFIIDETFASDGQNALNKYKNFNLVLLEKEYKSRLGRYSPKTKTIEVCSVNKIYFSNLMVTFFHELAHHIEFCKKGTTNHGEFFYRIHTKLLYKAIDTKLLRHKDILNISETSFARNRDKLSAMMNNYIPSKNTKSIYDICSLDFIKEYNKLSPINEVIKVCCNTKYNQIFKDRKYTWSDTEKVWYKHFVKKPDYIKECNFLLDQGFLCFNIRGAQYFCNEIMIVISGNSYKYKEQLKKLSYSYYNKEWKKKIFSNDYKQEIAKIKHFYGITISYQFIKK